MITHRPLSLTITTILFLAFLTVMAHLLIWSLDLPIVQISTSTGKCVRVLPMSAGTCDQLPEKYTTIPVR